MGGLRNVSISNNEILLAIEHRMRCDEFRCKWDSKFSVSFMLKNAKIKFIPMRQQSQQRNSSFSSRFTSNLMLSTCLLDIILVVNKVCNSKIA